MKQLKLSIPQLQAMGFTPRFCPEVRTEDSYSSEKTVYEINCLNGVFGYNPSSDEAYRWYQCITIGKSCNHISLDIHNLRSLYTTLRVFKVDHAEAVKAGLKAASIPTNEIRGLRIWERWF